MNKIKEIEIDMVVSVPDTEDQASISEKFIAWVVENGWTCGGYVKEITDQEQHQDSTL